MTQPGQRLASDEKRVMCGICEASCGLIATVADDRVMRLRGDAAHPNSRGYCCPKGASFHYFLEDPDRVLDPLQRQPDGSFKPVSWQTALDDIGVRLRRIIRDHGRESVGLYVGNPSGWNYGAFLSMVGMAAALKTRHYYTVGSVDVNNVWAVSEMLYGNFLVNPLPDLHRTDFLIVLGANPLVSHGAMMTTGHVAETLRAITARGGRVVVVDPRRSETAERFEHVPVRPDSDAWLVGAMLKIAFDEGLEDRQALATQANGADFLEQLVAGIDLDRAAAETGIPLPTIRRLTRDFCAAPRAVLYCRTGVAMGRFSSLTKYLVDAFNLATGKLDRPGGAVFGVPMIGTEQVVSWFGLTGYDRWRTRVDGVPEVAGSSPLAVLPREIETPGPGQLRAMLICSGNIASSGPASDRIEAALPKLDLLVSLDLFVNETSRHADYILPATTWLERDGWPIFTSGHSLVPYAQWTAAVVPPRGQARDDGWIIDQICRRIGIAPAPLAAAQWAAKIGLRVAPRLISDLLLRIAPHGDRFGLRPGGLSRRKLMAAGEAIRLAESLPVGVLRKHVYFPDRRVRLAQPVMADELARLVSRRPPAGLPLRLIGMREVRSQNSWMHNVPKLMAGRDRKQMLRVHPDDARACGLVDGGQARIVSARGEVVVPVRLTDEMMPGTVALPHGWGHAGTWRRAVAAGGVRYNVMTGNDPGEFDLPSGNAMFTGIPVRLEPAVG